jgi:hypothetical protein
MLLKRLIPLSRSEVKLGAQIGCRRGGIDAFRIFARRRLLAGPRPRAVSRRLIAPPSADDDILPHRRIAWLRLDGV